MVLDAERRGFLKPGSVIIEPTAGNTGIGLALIGRQRSYRVVLIVPANFSREKLALMQALGGEIVLTPEEAGMRGAIDRAYEIAAGTANAFVPQQFENPANPAWHYDTTAEEIWQQTEGRVDALVIGAGTGGTFTGVVKRFKEAGVVHAVLVEPQGSVWGGGAAGKHRVEGIGGSYWPGALDRTIVDEIITVSDDDALGMTARLARECGVLSGGSGGAAVHAAVAVARRMRRGQRVVTVVPDGMERYLSKGIVEAPSEVSA
jgi:cysteine synthase